MINPELSSAVFAVQFLYVHPGCLARMLARILAPAFLRAENAPTPSSLPGRYGFAAVRAEADHPGIPGQCLLDHGSPPSFIVQTLSCSLCPHIPSFMVPALGIFYRILVSQNQPKLSMYWFRCQGQHFDNFPHLIPLSAIIKPANSQSKHCRRFSNKILSSAFCSDLWYNDKHRTLLSPSFTN